MWALTPPFPFLKDLLKWKWVSENESIIRVTFESTIIYIKVKLASLFFFSLQTHLIIENEAQVGQDNGCLWKATCRSARPALPCWTGALQGLSHCRGRCGSGSDTGVLTSPWADGSGAAGDSACRGWRAGGRCDGSSWTALASWLPAAGSGAGGWCPLPRTGRWLWSSGICHLAVASAGPGIPLWVRIHGLSWGGALQTLGGQEPPLPPRPSLPIHHCMRQKASHHSPRTFDFFLFKQLYWEMIDIP